MAGSLVSDRHVEGIGVGVILSGICGAIVGVINGITLADIASAAVGGFYPFDVLFSSYWKKVLLVVAVPGAGIGMAVFFAFLHGMNILTPSAAVGTAGGAVFGFFIGPPESWASGLFPLSVLVKIFWEWLMGGAGGVVGWVIEKIYDRFCG